MAAVSATSRTGMGSSSVAHLGCGRENTVWKKGDPARRMHRWTRKSVGRASSERKITSASGALKMGSGEGEENIIVAWGWFKGADKQLDHLEQGALVRFHRA